eukprot:1150320-Pelagomonas_calceolata.AAC.9
MKLGPHVRKGIGKDIHKTGYMCASGMCQGSSGAPDAWTVNSYNHWPNAADKESCFKPGLQRPRPALETRPAHHALIYLPINVCRQSLLCTTCSKQSSGAGCSRKSCINSTHHCNILRKF